MTEPPLAYFFPDAMFGGDKAAILGLVVGGVLLVGSLVVPFVGRGGSEVDDAFRQRSLDYVAAFAEAAGGWLQEGDLETLGDAARFMLLGSAAFVEVVRGGEVLVRESRIDFSPPPVQAPVSEARASLVDQEGLLGVVYPLPRGDGYVRVLLERPSPGPGSTWVPTVAGILAVLGLGTVGGSLYFLRKPPPQPEGERELIRVGSLVIDEDRKEVRLLGKPVRLSPKQYALLLLLAREPGKVFSDREILRELWSGSRYADSKDVKQYVYLLRRRLGEVVPGAEALIATVPGFGYKLLSPEEIGLTGR